jgi:uncharacterized protein (TIGR03435 family)
MKPTGIFMVVVALTGIAHGQAFEVASIRESDPAAARLGIRGTIEPNPGSLSIRNTTLREATRWAYDEPGARVGVLAGPEWADTIRYDIVARATAASSVDQLRMMLRALLADRFKLVVRAERRENAVYLLTVDAKGHSLRPSTTNDPRRVQLDAKGLTFHNFTMNDLQLYLLNVPSVDRPVINRTGLEGRFDFSIPILLEAETPEARTAASRGGNFFVFAEALEELGVRLDRGTVPLDVITIEKAERPAEN